jgi:streptogramin lyase
VLGIVPVTPGFATFSVDPHPIGLSSASGSVTTPHGDISVSLKVIDGNTIVKVDAPAGTRQVAPVP